MPCKCLLFPRYAYKLILLSYLQSSAWIIQIEDDEPISSECAKETLEFLQIEGAKEIGTCPIKRSKLLSSSSNLDLRSAFNQSEASKYELESFTIIPTHNYLVALQPNQRTTEHASHDQRQASSLT